MASKATAKRQALPDPARLLKTQYGCGPVQFAGTSDALYERHLLFDSGLDPAEATARDRFEALARSVRDSLSTMKRSPPRFGDSCAIEVGSWPLSLRRSILPRLGKRVVNVRRTHL